MFARTNPGFNEIAFDYPLDGGGMVMLSRMWSLNPYVDMGLVGGGGVIERDLEVTQNSAPDLTASTKATVFPFVGPRLSLHGEVFGISLGYGFYYARTEFRVDGVNPSLSSKKNAWGQGFYSPLLTIDFYSKSWDMVFGFGLGGFFGTDYPTLEAENSTLRATSTEDPINTLTLHVRTRWYDGRRERETRDELE